MERSAGSLSFEDDTISDEAVVESISLIWHCFLKKVEDNELAALEIPYATELAMLKIRKMMELAILDHDGEFTESEPLEIMTPDGEPCPSTIDSWARGTVPIKKVVAEESFHVAHSSSAETMSVSSGYTGRSSSKRSHVSSSSRKGTGGKSTVDSLDNTGKIIELDDDLDREFAGLGTTGFMFDMLQKTRRKKGHGYVAKDAEKGEFDLMEEELAKARTELQGKRFVLDRYGKPVVVGAVKADKLPPFTTAPVLHIKNPTEHDHDDQGSQSVVSHGSTVNTYSTHATKKSLSSVQQQQPQDQATSNAPGQKNKPKQFVRVAGSRGVEESSFKPTISLATSLSGVERIPRLNPGVTVVSSNGKKSGESLPDDPIRISRKQYLSRTQLRQSPNNSYLDTTSMQSGSFSRTMDTPGGHQMSSSGLRNGGSGVLSSGKSMESLPDIDLFEGSRVIESTDSYKDLSDDDLGIGPRDTTGNIENASPLPVKPSDAQKLNIGKLKGHPENGKPRDRDVPKNQISLANRKHLPAPAIGRISGHGMTFEKLQEKKEMEQSGEEKWYEQWRK